MKRPEISYGLIVVDASAKPARLLLVQHRKGHWGFPKGHVEPGESPFQTARREVAEEVGLHDLPVLSDEMITHHYPVVKQGREVMKTVGYFVAAANGQTPVPHPGELLACEWLDAAETAKRLPPGSDAVLSRAAEILARVGIKL